MQMVMVGVTIGNRTIKHNFVYNKLKYYNSLIYEIQYLYRYCILNITPKGEES